MAFKDAVGKLDKKMRGFGEDTFELPDLLIPQRAPIGQMPLYPVISDFIEAGNTFDAATLNVENGYNRSASVEDRGREIFSYLAELPQLQPSNKELIEARKDPEKLKEFYMRPEVMHEVRVSELLLDVSRANIMGLWVKMSDENFQNFLGLVKEDKLPKCLTSDQEMKRLLDDSRSRSSNRAFTTLVKAPGVYVGESVEPRLSSARERLVDLVLDPDSYVKDDSGHVTSSKLGGPKNYEFDQNIKILSVMDRLRQEFPGEEK